MAKAKFANMSSLFTRHSINQSRADTNMDDIVKQGSLAKMEKNKTKYFVLRRETSKEYPACLEYYENISKFKDGSPPRKRYLLKDCYISRKAIERKAYAFALFINNKKCKTLIASSEDDLQDWLTKLHALKREISGCSNMGNVEYQRIWPVEIMNRGLASSQKLNRACLVCLNNWSLWLENDSREIPLNSIKNYGRMNEFFFLEVGRQSSIGAGNLWMKTEDSYIAQNMVDIIKDAIDRYGTLPHGRDSQDSDLGHQRTRGNSMSSFSHNTGGSQLRNRTCSESHSSASHIPITVRSPSTPFDPLHTPSRDYLGSAKLLTSSEEDNVSKNSREENEYVSMSNKSVESPSAEFLNSPSSENLPRADSSVNAYLDMGPIRVSSFTASTPIPIGNQSQSLQHEISPQSGNSSSATTSSDQIQDIEGRSGSESIVGSCFGANELLDRPIRTSSVGSKTEQYMRKNSAPMLSWSPASHSWSGTSGTYFRNLPGIYHPQENNTMMIDYSNPNIAHEEKEKKGFWSSLSGHRLRSNSKSSRGSNVKISESKEDTKPVDIPGKKRSDDYCEISYQGSLSHDFKGYLQMNPPKSRPSNSLERKMRLDRAYLEMSPSAEPTSDGYVDMSQSGSSLSASSEMDTTPPVNFNPTHRGSSSHDHLPPEKSNKKNNRKACKSKSMKEGSKDTPDVVTAKTKGTFSAFTRIIRKTSISKSPVNVHPPKPSPPSPISNLSRNISKDRLEEYEKAPLPTSLPQASAYNKSNEKLEEKMLFVPRDDSMPSHLRKISELSIADGGTQTKAENRARHSISDTSDCANRNYANLSLNASSPQISQYGRQTSFVEVSPRVSSSIGPKMSPSVAIKNDGYLMMSSTIAGPHSTNRQSKNDTVLQVDSSHSSGERSRSLSGPGGPVDASKDKKIPSERTTSASSSPTSRSPTVTPGLGSVSSISSLSEGGLSSSSSTCTVVNVGAARNKCPSGGTPQPTSTTLPVTTQDTEKSRPASLNINYASLDLVNKPEGSPRLSRSRDASKDSNYCEIDFVKSEGLRNTSLARNSSCQ